MELIKKRILLWDLRRRKQTLHQNQQISRAITSVKENLQQQPRAILMKSKIQRTHKKNKALLLKMGTKRTIQHLQVAALVTKSQAAVMPMSREHTQEEQKFIMLMELRPLTHQGHLDTGLTDHMVQITMIEQKQRFIIQSGSDFCFNLYASYLLL